jgi:hypothetical protein
VGFRVRASEKTTSKHLANKKAASATLCDGCTRGYLINVARAI